MSIDTEYCKHCGFLHDAIYDDNCSGCEVMAENKKLKEENKKLIQEKLGNQGILQQSVRETRMLREQIRRFEKQVAHLLHVYNKMGRIDFNVEGKQ